MNKKGFTLVELLAVIAILAILVVMLVPNVIETLNQSKKSTFITQAQTILKTAQEDWILNGEGKATTYCYDGNDAHSSYSKLSLSGSTEIKYIITINTSGEVTSFTAYSNSYQYTGSSKIIVTDISAESVETKSNASVTCY